MENECHQLDLKLAQHTTGQSGDRAGFLKYSAIIHEIQTLEEKRGRQKSHVDMLDSVLTVIALQRDDSETNPQVQVIRQGAVTARLQLDELVNYLIKTESHLDVISIMHNYTYKP